MVKLIAKAHNRKVCLIPGFTWALKILSHMTGLVNKAFGSLTYDEVMSEYPRGKYQMHSLKDSRDTEEACKN